MRTEKTRKPPSRVFWISVTLNACLAFLGWAIVTDHAVLSLKPLTVASAPQAQFMPASLPVNPYLAGRE